MFYVRIHYGLGNQMFQYAFAKNISLIHEVPAELDLSFYRKASYNDEAQRLYALNNFNITLPQAKTDEIERFVKPNFLQRRLRQLESITKPAQSRSFIAEDVKPFDAYMLQVSHQAYFFGYWADERYFKENEIVIRNEFTFKNPAKGKNSEFVERIESSNAVAIHIRRGDYLTDKFATTSLCTCSLEYYAKAIVFFKERIDNVCFYIFSDDIEWAQENLHCNAPAFFIDHNGDDGVEDLRLMSHCKHFIIANSTFSWWGAWLGSHPDKVVIGPKNWYTSGGTIMPDQWLKF